MSRRIFPLCFLLLNAVGLFCGLWIWQRHLQSADRQVPELLHTPGDLELLQAREPVHWQWNIAVASPTNPGEWLEDAPVMLEPPVSGNFRWSSEKVLEFHPSEDWPPARQVAFQLQTLSTNIHQQVFSLNHLSQISGPPLEVERVSPFYDEDRNRLEVRLRFNAPVELKMLTQYLQLLDEDGDPVEVDAVRETPLPEEFLMKDSWFGEGKRTLLIQQGLRSVYPQGAALPRDHSTEIKEQGHFTLTGLAAEMPTFGQGEIELSFSQPAALQSLQDGIQIEPEVSFSVGSKHWWKRNSSVLTGDFQPDTRYRITLSEGLRSLQQKKLKTEVSREVLMPGRDPGLRFVSEGWILNARGAGEIELENVNEGRLTLRLDRVHQNNLVAYAARAGGMDGWRSKSNPDRNLKELVIEKTLQNVPDGLVKLNLLQELEATGQGLYRLEVTGENSGTQITRMIALSDVGLMARRTGDELLVWALRLDSAEGVSNMEVTLWDETRQLIGEGQTNADGICILKLEEDARPLVVLAQGGEGLGLLNLQGAEGFPVTNGSRDYLDQGHEAYVYTDRGMYRPGEELHLRGVVRGKGFSLPGRFPVEWKIRDPANRLLWRKTMRLSEIGTATVSVAMPREWPTGRYTLQLSLPGDDSPVLGATRVHVEAFVPPQLVVEADVPEGEEAVGDKFTVQVGARMLYGGPAANHKGSASFTLLPEYFRSSEYPEHVFSDARKSGFGQWSRSLGKFVTDAEGRTTLSVEVPADKVSQCALRAVVGVTVQDFSGRSASTFVSRRVDRVPYYPGVNLSQGEEGWLLVDGVGLYPSGEMIAESHALEMRWYRVNWQSGYRRDSHGRYSWFSDSVDVEEGQRQVQLVQGRFTGEIDLSAPGTYRVALVDPETGASCSKLIHTGGSGGKPDRADRVELRFDREKYRPGDQGVVTISAPFEGNLLLSLESGEMLWHRRAALTEGNEEISFTVPESAAVNLWMRAVLVRPQPGNGAVPVLRAEGAAPLLLDRGRLEKPLTLEVAEQLRPSSEVELLLRGEPGAEVVVAGVDKGILMLDNFKTPDPLKWFLALRRAGSISWDGFDDLLPELGQNPFAGDASMGGGVAAVEGNRLNPVDAKRFRPLAWWSGTRRIPESGELRMKMAMPEFSGAVRWMAVQVSAAGMGSAEAVSKVGRDVVVQQSLPLFMAPGDQCLWSVRVHNRSDEKKVITLKPGVNALLETDGSNRMLTLQPGEVVVTDWTVKALTEIGKAEFSLGVKCGEAFWQEDLELAVRPVTGFESHSTRLLLAPGDEFPIPEGAAMLAGTGERRLQVHGLQVLQLSAARNFLLRYPYGCVEQTVSAAAPALYMPDWAEGSAEASRDILQAAVMALWKKQRRDGGFGYWHGSDSVSVSGSLGALSFLLEAAEREVEVDAVALTRGLDWAENWLRGQQWSLEYKRHNLLLARCCAVLARAGRLDAGWMQGLRERKMEMDGYGRVVAAEALMYGGQRPQALEMLEGLSRVDHGWGWQSQLSGNAEFLWLLLKLNPRDARIYPLVEEILSGRNTQGRWAHSYENARVIRAFTAYAAAWPGEAEDFNVGIIRGQGPFLKMQDGESADIGFGSGYGTLINQGKRPVYVEITQEGFPVNPLPVKNSFTVDRQLLRMNGSRVKADEGLESGELLVMRFRISNLPARVEYLVLDQPLPAGLEPLPSSQQQKPWKRMLSTPKEKISEPRNLEIRDDRILIFPHELSTGEKLYFVLVRAVSPGRYRFPAVYAQDMYDDAMVFKGEESVLEVQR